jgi:quinol monooxygenase YgiN
VSGLTQADDAANTPIAKYYAFGSERQQIATADSEERLMLVLRFKVQCQADGIDQALAAFKAVIGPSRKVQGVISFDIARDLADPDSIIAVEVFEDAAARERQESLPEVANVMNLLPAVVAAPPEATVFEVSSAADAT